MLPLLSQFRSRPRPVISGGGGGSGSEIITAVSSLGTSRTNFGSPIGFFFSTPYDLQVTHLGTYKISGSGTHRVAVYGLLNSGGPPELFGETINFSGQPNGSFVYNQLATPYDLPAGAYFLVSTFATSGDPWPDNNGIETFNSDVLVFGSAYWNPSQNEWEAAVAGQASFTLPNLKYNRGTLRNYLVNGDFELGRLCNDSGASHVTNSRYYTYNPTTYVPGWTFNNGSGIMLADTSGNGFQANATGFHGYQAGFLQRGDLAGFVAEISQSVTVPGGTYTLSWQSQQRQGVNPTSQTYSLYVDGVFVRNYNPTGSGWTLHSETLSLSAGSHTILFKGINPNGGDNTAYVDNAILI